MTPKGHLRVRSTPIIQPTQTLDTHQTLIPDTQPTLIPDTQPTLIPDTQPILIPDTQPTLIPDTQHTLIPDTQPSLIPDIILMLDISRIRGTQHRQIPGFQVTKTACTNQTVGILLIQRRNAHHTQTVAMQSPLSEDHLPLCPRLQSIIIPQVQGST